MDKNINDLEISEIGKSVVFYSPLEGENILVRTGISKDKNFISAVLYASSKNYADLNHIQRHNITQKLNDEIFAKICKTNWNENQNDLTNKFFIKEKLVDVTMKIYACIFGKKKSEVINVLLLNNENNIEMYKIIAEIFPEKIFIKSIVSSFDSDEDINVIKKQTISKMKSQFNNLLVEYEDVLPKDKKIFCVSKFEDLIKNTIKISEELAYKNYVKNLQKTDIFPTPESVDLISNKINKNIYFLNGKDRLPCKIFDKDNSEGKNTIVLIKIKDDHYEVVGKLLKGNKIQRIFDSKEDFYQKIYSLLYDHSYVKHNFPHLVKYVKNMRKNSNSDSEEESKSESEESEHDSDIEFPIETKNNISDLKNSEDECSDSSTNEDEDSDITEDEDSE